MRQGRPTAGPPSRQSSGRRQGEQPTYRHTPGSAAVPSPAVRVRRASDAPPSGALCQRASAGGFGGFSELGGRACLYCGGRGGYCAPPRIQFLDNSKNIPAASSTRSSPQRKSPRGARGPASQPRPSRLARRWWVSISTPPRGEAAGIALRYSPRGFLNARILPPWSCSGTSTRRATRTTRGARVVSAPRTGGIQRPA